MRATTFLLILVLLIALLCCFALATNQNEPEGGEGEGEGEGGEEPQGKPKKKFPKKPQGKPKKGNQQPEGGEGEGEGEGEEPEGGEGEGEGEQPKFKPKKGKCNNRNKAIQCVQGWVPKCKQQYKHDKNAMGYCFGWSRSYCEQQHPFDKKKCGGLYDSYKQCYQHFAGGNGKKGECQYTKNNEQDVMYCIGWARSYCREQTSN